MQGGSCRSSEECDKLGKPPKIAEVNYLQNFEYTINHIRVWKAYGVGDGKCIAWTDLEKTPINWSTSF